MSLAGSCWHGNARAAKRARWRPEPARREPRNQVRQPQCRWRRRILAFRRDRTKNPPRTTLHNHSIIRVVSNNGSFRPETNYDVGTVYNGSNDQLIVTGPLTVGNNVFIHFKAPSSSSGLDA